MKATTLKEKAADCLRLVASGNISDAYRYIGPGFLHHNPYFRGDAASLRTAMEENAAEHPDKILDIKLAVQEGEYVAVFSHIRQNREDRGAAVVHIFRFKDGLIAEMWDIGQAVPEQSPNENGMF